MQSNPDATKDVVLARIETTIRCGNFFARVDGELRMSAPLVMAKVGQGGLKTARLSQFSHSPLEGIAQVNARQQRLEPVSAEEVM